MFSRKDLVRLLVPLVIEQILAVLVGMVDVVMVAAVGEAAVSGVSLVDSLSVLIIQVFAALATGGAVVCAQYLGKKKPERACQAAGQLLLSSFLLSMVVMVVALAGNQFLLRTIFGKIDGEVMRNASIYFLISALSYPFLALYNSCAALFRSMGNSKVSMETSMVMNGINVAGNALCIYGLGMGVEGVAIPTLISRMTAALIMLSLIKKPVNPIHIVSFRKLGFQADMIKKIFAVGIPNSMENCIFHFGKISLQSLVAALGTVSIAGYAVACNLATIEYLPGNAIGLGLITVVGQCVGAGEWEQARYYTKKLLGLNYILLAFICVGMAVFIRPVVGIYNLSPEAAKIACTMMLMHSAAMVVWPVSFTMTNYLRASGDAKFTMCVSVSTMWIFRIGVGFLLVKFMGFPVWGIWIGMFADWIVRAVIFIWRFCTRKKMKI